MEITGNPNLSALRMAATKLEANFLAEMLKASGLHKATGPFGGESEADQFTSFMRQAQAEAMSRSGGIGLAEAIFQALVASSHE